MVSERLPGCKVIKKHLHFTEEGKALLYIRASYVSDHDLYISHVVQCCSFAPGQSWIRCQQVLKVMRLALWQACRLAA